MTTTTTLAPFLRRADLENSRWFGPHLFSFLATGDDTDGQFALVEMQLLAGYEPPPHTHRIDDESFYVLDGEIEYQIGSQTVQARRGDFVILPVGVEHGFRIVSGQARALLLSAPSGLEEAFTALSEPARRLQIRREAPPFDPGRFVTEFGKQGLTFRSPNAAEPITQPNPALAARPMPGFSRWYFGHLLTTLAKGAQTGGRFAVTEIASRRGQEPPPHIHHREDEGYYVLDGEVTFHCDDRSFAARRGDFVFLPRELPHSFNIQTDVARMVMLLTPAGLEDYFLEYSQPAEALVLPPRPSDAYDPEEMVRAGARYGFEFLPRAEKA